MYINFYWSHTIARQPNVLLVVNLALNKHATITSRAHFWSRPELANDGNDGQDDAECTQTIHNVTEAWWQVDLIGASILSVHITYAQNSKFYLGILVFDKRFINDWPWYLYTYLFRKTVRVFLLKHEFFVNLQLKKGKKERKTCKRGFQKCEY